VPDYPRAQRLLEEVVVRDPDDRAALTRLAAVALRAGDGRRAAVVHQHLAESGEPEQRARSLLALADLQSEMGDAAAADAAAAAALDLTADTPDLIALLEQHYRSRGELERHAALVEEALRRMPLRAPGVLPLRLALARVLGRDLGAREQALEHLHQATRGYPKATGPRIALAEVLADDEPDAAIAELRRIIEDQPTEAAAFAGLAAVCRSRGWIAPATLMTTAAALLGGDAVPDELERDLASPQRPTPGSLPPEDALRFLVGASQVTAVREILELLDPYLPAIFPDGQELVGMLEPLPGMEPAAALARSIAHALAVGSVDIYRGDAGDPLLLMSEPRALVLDPHHLGSAGRTSFDAASALSRLAAGSAVGQVLEPDRVQALLRVATDPAVDPAHRDLRKRLTSAIPRRARKDLERTAADVGVIDQRRWAVWEQEERRRARRAGVVFSRDLRAAAVSIVPDAVTAPVERRLALIAASEPMMDALRFAASDTCWSLCRRIFRG
jgi:tetratricopeptide (TPR) repeat protein